MRKWLLGIACTATLFFLINGCFVIGLTNDYGKLTGEERLMVKEWESLENQEIGFVYKAHAGQLKEAMKDYPASMVYIFSNGCPYAPDLSVIENYATARNLQLFLVMTGYGLIGKTFVQKPQQPLYVIDDVYYGKRLSHRYLKNFRNHLLEGAKTEITEKHEMGSIFLFGFDQLEDIHELDSLNND